MCGRFAQHQPTITYARCLGLDPAHRYGDLAPRYNIAPSEYVLVARMAAWDSIEFVTLKWGLIPHWAPENFRGPHPINARVETVASQAMFRHALHSHRCLVPADGFFEWKIQSGGKQPYYFCLRSGEPMFFAGLWACRQRPNDNDDVTFAILVGPANALVGEIHDRMPIIVPTEVRDAWLDVRPMTTDPGKLLSSLHPYPADEMQRYPVSRAVNSSQNKGPECIEPAGPM